MTNVQIKEALRKIGLALNASNNTVITDSVYAEPRETSWRINHNNELKLLDDIEKALFSNDTCHGCGDHSSRP